MKKEDVLYKYFGYTEFRSIQGKAIDSILEGNDTLVIMATGGGKSVVFQIPGIIFPGLTIVISPLISLMSDQVSNLKSRNIKAETINSSVEYFKELEIIDSIKSGELKFLYVSPERLSNKNFIEILKSTNISQLVIDESHCINWGLDFRPSYLHIKEFVDSLSNRPVISCFTATASYDVIKMIKNTLSIDPKVFKSSFDRPNLYYEVIHTKDKKSFLLDFIKKHQESCGIIYTLTRKKAEELFQALIDSGISTSLYHGGLDDDIRRIYQEEFLSGKTNVLVGTNSFGMGIDKPDIRYVINYELPESIEDLSQEQGRCSRDGKPGLCILLYNEADLYINEYFINSIEMSLDLSNEEIKRIKKIKREKLKDVIGYATTRRCLHEYLVSYFGELYMSYCDNCSNCIDSYEYVDALPGAKIIHSFVKTYNNRFGINLIAETLAGIRGEGAIKNRLIYSPFFKRLKINKDQIKEIILKMIEDKYLIKSDGKYPVIGLSLDHEVVLNLEEYKIKVFKENSIVSRILGASKVSLKDKLISFRNIKAKREGVPVYQVLTEDTIKEICNNKPKTKTELLKINGIGEKKLNRYGNEIISIIKDYYL